MSIRADDTDDASAYTDVPSCSSSGSKTDNESGNGHQIYPPDAEALVVLELNQDENINFLNSDEDIEGA